MSRPSLASKVALVTGGSTGIGRAAALELAQAGAQVIITGRAEASLREAAARHPAITWFVADVSRTQDSAATVEEVRRRHGRLDVLVNNAGIAPIAPLEQASPDHVREVLDVNVAGLVELTRQALPLLEESRGTIINVASVVADRPFGGMSIYSASKAAVLALTRAWAQELGPAGVRVNAVSPGPTDTPIFGKMGLAADQADQMASRILERVPLHRFGTPEEVAAVIGFLASPASSFVTGAQYPVGGGIEA